MSWETIGTKQEKVWYAKYILLHDLTNAAASVQVLIDLVEESVSDEIRIEYLRLLQMSIHQLSSRIDHEKALLDHVSRRPG